MKSVQIVAVGLEDDVVEELARLLCHQRDQIDGENVGKTSVSFSMESYLVELQPLLVEVRDHVVRFGIGQHAIDLGRDRPPACVSLSAVSGGEELSSGMLCQSMYERRDAISQLVEPTTVSPLPPAAPNSTR